MMLESRSVANSLYLLVDRGLTVPQPKMVYASSKDALKRALNGIAVEFQGNDTDDIEYSTVLGKVSKGLA
jgi:hypothetical protein